MTAGLSTAYLVVGGSAIHRLAAEMVLVGVLAAGSAVVVYLGGERRYRGGRRE